MEPKIRDYINEDYLANFLEDTIIKEEEIISKRCNYDGLDRESEMCLEIKTTSNIHDTILEYDYYLVQLLYGMYLSGFKKGILAVYERPSNFSVRFKSERLQVFEVNYDDHLDLMNKILEEIELFKKDLKELKDKGITNKYELVPNEVKEIFKKIEILETQMEQYKVIENEHKSLKKSLYEQMLSAKVFNWKTPNGTSIALINEVKGGEEEVETFDMESFKRDNEELYKQYLVKEIKKKNGKVGFIKITTPKTKEKK